MPQEGKGTWRGGTHRRPWGIKMQEANLMYIHWQEEATARQEAEEQWAEET